MCAQAGCSELVEVGRCSRHAKVAGQQYDRTRKSPSARGYDAAWQRMSKAKLAAEPYCQINDICRNAPLIRKLATEVDHRIPISVRPDLRLDWENLQSACKPCHSAKTRREGTPNLYSDAPLVP